jgi:hypothetical protein
MGDTERIVGGGASGTFELGYAEGSFLTPPTAPGPYTIIFYEDANLDTIPDEGGLQVPTTFTCPEPPGGEEPPLTEQFRNQGQCIAYSNSNPNSGITKEECQGAFTGNNGRNNNN